MHVQAGIKPWLFAVARLAAEAPVAATARSAFLLRPELKVPMRVLPQAALSTSAPLEGAAAIRVVGQPVLNGAIRNEGAKNAALPILAATLLGEEQVALANLPSCSDVADMAALLRGLGSSIFRDGGSTIVVPGKTRDSNLPMGEARRIRASLLLAGPLLARYGTVMIPPPGGCRIGTRAIDLHLSGLAAMGATWSLSTAGFVRVSAARLSGADIELRYPSVGATLNLMMAATLADGETIIRNAACEPEVGDVARFLKSMGARIQGAGGPTLTVQGSGLTKPVTHRIMPDRIAAATYLCMGAVCGDNLVVEDVVPEHITKPLAVLREMGAIVRRRGSRFMVSAGETTCTNLITGPYPGFPTDLQPIFAALMARSQGTGTIQETVFDGRYGYVAQMARMGARAVVVDGTLSIRGGNLLPGTVVAVDIRGGAALVLAALSAPGVSSIGGYRNIQRGYGSMASKLLSAGAAIATDDGGSSHADHQ